MFKSAEKKISVYSRNFLRAAASRGRTIAWFAFGATIIFTLVLWKIVKDETKEAAEDHFSFRTSEINISIQKRIGAYEQVLRGGIGLFKSSEEVTRRDWFVYVSNLKIEENYPGILGIGYSQVVKPEEKEEHIQKIRAEGFGDYRIWPEGEREIYTSIIYLEPFTFRNKRAFGYDMFSERVRNEAMTLARDRGTPTISGKVTLVQEMKSDVQSGFLMYLPLYDEIVYSKSPVEKKRETIKGFVYAPFRMNDLMKGILGTEINDIHLEIYDSSIADTSILFNSKVFEPGKNFQINPVFSSVEKLNLNNRTWHLKFSSLPVFEANNIDSEKPAIVLFSGISISILILAVAITLTFARRFYKQLEQILESTGEGVFGIDEKGKCSFINQSASKMLGFTLDDCLNKNIHDLIHHTDKDGKKINRNECIILKSLANKKGCRINNEIFWRSDGTWFPVEFAVNPIISNNELKGGVVSFNDITERRKSEQLIEDSLKEKEILLKEIHHRVKNNMQIISSLLNLQSRNLSDIKVNELMRESQNRIRSMALIHEKLYQSGDLTNINLNDYLKDLSSNLLNTYRFHRNIDIKINSETIFLNIDTAIYLGLIINELISNTLKHAFTNSKEGEITIDIKKTDPEILKIKVKDNGKGFPEEINFKSTKTLGLQLVNSLMVQLDGEIEMISNGGTEFNLTIKI